MKTLFLPFLMILFAATNAFAQEKFEIHSRPSARTGSAQGNNEPLSTGFSGTGANIDVTYHRVNWTVDPNAGSNITGTITTFFKTIQPNVAVISFDLVKQSFQNSVTALYHGINCSVSFPSSGNTDVLTIQLPSVIPVTNTIDSVTISYSGVPIEDGLGGGFVRDSYPDEFGQVQNYITTLSESYEDKNWWPCKADMQDKVDSMDMHITVPWNGADTFWAAGVGVLTDSLITGDWRTYTYKTRYPIASYLVFISAAKFNRYYSSVEVNESNIPVYWYLLGGKQQPYYTAALAAMEKINPVLQEFSKVVGEYPFKNEKHGFYDGLAGAAGMEHQTFSGMASNALTSLTTLNHELMHQWFGDNVTFATWNDLWLAEGFARYGEILAAELVPSLGYSPFTRRRGRKNAALSLLNTSAWIPDGNIANSGTIWNTSYGSAIYERGCMIVSMLRTMCGDEKFFAALRNYQTQLSGKAATTDTLKRFFNEQLGTDISEFFRDYVGGSGNAATATGGRGNPIYEIKWNSPAENNFLVGVKSQSRTAGSNVSYFNGPVTVRAVQYDPPADTTIVFFDWGNGNLAKAGNGIQAPVSNNLLNYNLSFTPDSLFYDDSARTMSTGSTVLDTTLKGFVWHGTSNSNWFDAANWAACCGVPPAGADVTIASINFPPVLNSSVSVNDITINTGKFIALGENTFTVSGAIKGNGGLAGSPGSNLSITGKAGTLRFVTGIYDDLAIGSLTLGANAAASIATNVFVGSVNVHPLAQLTVLTGVRLTTN
ncbi:MAG TPA: M1 family aminopeptidase [Ferruginibacter sp.]|nr:M1 family aminopeptidase [Ferruginibacter sp.]